MSATPAAVDLGKLSARVPGSPLEIAIYQTLAIMTQGNVLAKFNDVAALAAQIWRRLTLPGKNHVDGCTTLGIRDALNELVEAGALSFGLPQRKRGASEILAVVGGNRI